MHHRVSAANRSRRVSRKVLCVLLAAMAGPAGAGTVRHTGEVFSDRFVAPHRGTGPRMAYIGVTTFTMGSSPEEIGYAAREARHTVTLSPYALAVDEVTNAEYCRFLNEEGNQIEDGRPWALVGPETHGKIRRRNGRFVPVKGYDRHPVVALSWLGAAAYCRWLSARTGRAYHLPTEAQWECGARAGATTYWYWGDTFRPALLNCRQTHAATGTMPVGSYPPNPWGLQDMLGNVWEWALDTFSEDFYWMSLKQDPVLYDGDNWTPVIRGGSYKDSLEFCRPGFRADLWWWGDYDNVGFRVACDEE